MTLLARLFYFVRELLADDGGRERRERRERSLFISYLVMQY